MAGRGTDIRLGGANGKTREAVTALGGLYVIGTNRHESLRIDSQLRGRAGRQGDPGSSRFFVSLEDDLFVKYRLCDLLPGGRARPDESGEIDNPLVRSEINRVQRLTDDIAPAYSDTGASAPVGFTSSQWGSLASIDGPKQPGIKRRYGDHGNSFVAVVEFGPRIRAMAVTAGGESGDPHSPHFDDEAVRYATGDLREVYFYPDQLTGHTERTYHPGD
jgi:hypothetical protein